MDVVAGRDLERTRRWAKSAGVGKYTTRVDEVLGSTMVDAVVLAVPPRAQPELAVRAFGEGKHVLCEKPLAVSMAAGRRVVEAWRKSGRVGMVNFCYRLVPEIHALKSRLAAGEVGHVQSIHVDWILSSRLDGSLTQHWKGREEEGGGVLQNYGSHVLDYLLHDASNISCHGAKRDIFIKTRPDARGLQQFSTGDEVASVIYGLGADTVALIHLSLVSLPALGHRIVARGSLGTLEVLNSNSSFPGGPFRLRRYLNGVRAESSTNDRECDSYGLSSLFARVARRFVESIRTGERIGPTVECGLRVVERIHEIQQYTGRR